ncbi:MAG: biotin/lipoyl-containing protein [Opitutaceae bacterium]|jgi:biotin carboxyl carrier protein
MKKLRVTVEGKAYEVLVEILDDAQGSGRSGDIPTSASVSSASVTAPAVAPKPKIAAAGAGDVTSPLAGKIVSVDVKEGQTVTEGQQVATIEAMKMNTYLYASKAGVVASIAVKPGDSIEEGGILLKIS